MEKQQNQKMERKGRIATKKKKNDNKRNVRNHDRVWPLLLAAFCSNYLEEKTLIKKCLNKILSSLPRLRLPPILALIPSLLESE